MTEEQACREIEIEAIAEDLAVEHFIAKEAEDEKKRLRDVFFEAVTASWTTTELARKTIQVPDDVPASAADEYVLTYNPGWRLVADQPEWHPDEREVVIEEDPAWKPDTVLVAVENLTDAQGTKKAGYKVTKTVANGSAMVDEVRIQNVEPSLWEAIAQPRGYDWITEMLYHQNVDQEDLTKAIEEFLPEDWPWEIRTDLTDAEMDQLRPYTYEGPKQLRLNIVYATEKDFA